MAKEFDKVKVGDSVFVIYIEKSLLPTKNIVKEFKVKEIVPVPKAMHVIMTLSDNTVITPSLAIGFHVVDKSPLYDNTKCSTDYRESISKEIYATSYDECVRIAGNLVKMSMSNLHKIIDRCQSELNLLISAEYILSELRKNAPIEKVCETVIV